MSSSSESLKVTYKDKEIEACIDRPEGKKNGHCIILTHAASADMNQKALQNVADAVTQQGFTCVRFTCKTINLGYRTKVFRSVMEYVHEEEEMKGYFFGGRAMGSRAALNLANEMGPSDGTHEVKGVICMGYPLHAENDKEKLNDEPLKALKVPGVFVSTVKDKTCDSDLMAKALEGKDEAQVEWVEPAEHFRKASGRKETDVFEDINQIIIKWCKKIIGEDTENGAEGKKKEDKKAAKEEGKKRKSGGGDGKEEQEVKSKKSKDEK